VSLPKKYTVKDLWHRNAVKITAVDTGIADHKVGCVYIFFWHLQVCQFYPFWVVLIHSYYLTTIPSCDCEWLIDLFIFHPKNHYRMIVDMPKKKKERLAMKGRKHSKTYELLHLTDSHVELDVLCIFIFLYTVLCSLC
jgi:hypothetical protein